jgi:hypothetical protein
MDSAMDVGNMEPWPGIHWNNSNSHLQSGTIPILSKAQQ